MKNKLSPIYCNKNTNNDCNLDCISFKPEKELIKISK